MEDANVTQTAPAGVGEKKFRPDMTVGEAMQVHPRAREVFAGFHLGGCSHCSISEFETVEQICEGYGVPIDMLLGALNSLFDMK